MRKISLLLLTIFTLLTSCISQKKYLELEDLQRNTKSLLDTATIKLNSCNEEKETAQAEKEVSVQDDDIPF